MKLKSFDGLWVMGKERSQDKGEGQKGRSEMPHTKQMPPICVLGYIFSFPFSNIRWKLASPPEEGKALKPQGPIFFTGMAGKSGAEVEGIPLVPQAHV